MLTMTDALHRRTMLYARLSTIPVEVVRSA